MTDTTAQKVNVNESSQGTMGQKYLASGEKVALRLWENEPPNHDKQNAQRDYETVGYVLQGQANLYIEDRQISLKPGDSWVVPAGALHRYEILESFSAIEATSPPARAENRDQA